MRRHTHPALLASLLAAAACGTSPTAPEAGRAPAGAAVTLTAVGDTTAVAGGAPVLASELRWLDELPVLDPEALAAGRVQAAAPGTAPLRTGDGGVLTVRVVPARPLVLGASVAPGGDVDTLLLRGFRLRELAAVRVGGEAARVLGGDSATLRLALAPLADAGCTGGGVAQAVDVQGADAAQGLAVARPRRGDLRLAVGQAVRLSPEAAACLRFAPAAGARYALAFLDTRKLRDAESGFEGYAPSPLAYTVTVAEAGSAAPATPALRPPAAPSPDRAAAADASAPAGLVRRAAPWREGERFAVGDVPGAASATARVVRVYGGHLVLALAEGEEAAGGTAAWLARADSAFARAAASAYPLLRAALTPTQPLHQRRLRPAPGAGAPRLRRRAGRQPHAHRGRAQAVVRAAQHRVRDHRRRAAQDAGPRAGARLAGAVRLGDAPRRARPLPAPRPPGRPRGTPSCSPRWSPRGWRGSG